MNVQDKRATYRTMLLAGALALLAVVAWRVLTLGLADHLARSNPNAALVWRANHPEALLRRAEKNILGSAPAKALDGTGHAAIRVAPLDGRGYLFLARQAELRGELRSAAELYSLSASRGPRDLQTRRWLVNHALARGDYAQALANMDQMLRVQPERSHDLERVLVDLASHAPAQAEMAAMLLQNPPWRPSLLPKMIGRSPSSAALFNLMERLRRSPPGLSEAELAAWLARLAGDRQWSAAYLTWAQSLSPVASQRIGNVYNGSFELEPSNAGFDWQFKRVQGVQVSRVQVTGAADTLALRLGFEGQRVPFNHVRQLLALAPGTYRLQGQVRLDDLRSERGLVWTLTCAEDGRAIAETEPFSGRRNWDEFSLDFQIPAADCGGQWLSLRLPSRIPAEELIGGVAWFDDLQIQAISPK